MWMRRSTRQRTSTCPIHPAGRSLAAYVCSRSNPYEVPGAQAPRATRRSPGALASGAPGSWLTQIAIATNLVQNRSLAQLLLQFTYDVFDVADQFAQAFFGGFHFQQL